MASDAQDMLYEIFATLSGSPPAGVNSGLLGTVAEAAGGGSKPAPAGRGPGNTAATVAMDVLKSGFGMVTLVSTLLGLFGGGEAAAPPPLVKYAMPAAREFEAAETSSGLANVDYGQSGAPRAYESRAAGSLPPIQVTVQAMDARSFLDRS